jgi:Gas vesicle synthesis protein GvpO
MPPAAKRQNGGRRKGLSAGDVVQRVRDELPALLGRPLESVLGVQRDDEDGWLVTVAVVELRRIPNSTDVLGAYAVTLDDGGELTGYQRRRRYNRSQADED